MEINGLTNLALENYSQEDSSRPSSSIIYFIVPSGKTPTTCTSKLISAKKLCVDYLLTTEWLSAEDALKATPMTGNIYVLDPFSGPVFEYLKEHLTQTKSFMVIGPQCLRYGLEKQDGNTIQNKGYPFCSLAMQNTCITLSGFSKPVSAELTDLVQKMNGIVSKAYSVATTHVVAENTLTPKCIEAYKNDVVVMTEDWIRAVWSECQDELIDATDPKYIEYHCPVFHNVQICVSQIPSNLKARLQKTITTNGGFYSKDFKRDVTDILVCPFASGEKYKFAKQWGVTCVTREWIDASKQAGHVLPFENFRPPRLPTDQLCSTQIDAHRPVQIPEFTLGSLTTCSAIGEGPDNSKIDMVNATYMTEVSTASSMAPPPPQQGRGIKVEEDVNLNDSLDILRQAPAGFLDSCTIYLCEHNSGDEKINEVRKILNSSGATRSDKITEKVSHILVINGKISEQEIQTIKYVGHDPHVVSLDWLLQSAKQESPANEELYAFCVPQLKDDSICEKVSYNGSDSSKTTAFRFDSNDSIKEKGNNSQISNFRTITPVNSSKTGSGASKLVTPFLQIGGATAQRLDFESDFETPPAKQPVKLLKSLSSGVIQSPLLRPGMSLEGSKQLKRALALTCEPSPETNVVKRRKSTPFSEVKKGFWDDVEEKNRRWKGMDEALSPDTIVNPMRVEEPRQNRESESGLDQRNTFGEKEVEVVESRNGRDAPAEKRQTREREAHTSVAPENPPPVEKRQTRQTRKGSSSSETSSLSTMVTRRRGEKSKQLNVKTSKKFTTPLVFVLSGCSGTEKASAKTLIEELGGVISAVDFHDRTANAVIAFKVTRSEKILGAIALGQPILHPNYLTACQDADRLLEFQEYTWKEQDGTSESEKNMVRVSRFWYAKIKDDPSERPYVNFRVYLVEQKQQKREAYKRLIEAGGGEIHADVENVNIIIGDGKEALAQAAQAKVPVKVPMFLNDVIISFEDVSWLV